MTIREKSDAQIAAWVLGGMVIAVLVAACVGALVYAAVEAVSR